MSDYIDLAVVAKVIGVGLLLGAGLPLVFSLGLRSVSTGTQSAAEGSSAPSGGFTLTRNPAALAAGVVCFAVVAAAIVFGISIIVNKS